MLLAACTPEKDIVSTPAPVLQPIVDSAPYICRLVPEQAFRLVSDATGSLVEKTDGSESSGECWAPDTTPRSLEVGWLQVSDGTNQEHLNFVMNGRRQVYSEHGGVTLPTDLGDGLAAYLPNTPFADQPYRVSAKFLCGGKARMIDIFLAKVAKGRDAIKDMTELMRIAQKRYGHLYNCTPGK
ncbi:hypothetical protein [Nonomuraea guangzhouensis]|uniref:DUF3558 domain-containing protein n=1 Tax=Nonomuraea guangzhouensis TaxID=1291555 RepID=A0ABW4GVP5_9ACTN|nr:hypothetical protein [Nonomuraea guangzhouensis]